MERPHVAIIRPIRIQTRSMIKLRVQFVVAHNCDAMPLVLHGADEGQDRSVRTAPVDEIAQERRDTPLRMRPSLSARYIAEDRQRLRQAVYVNVNIGNDVIALLHAKCPQKPDLQPWSRFKRAR